MAKAKTKSKSKKKKKLRKVPHTNYELVWDARREQCTFGHKNGTTADLKCGVTDSVSVLSDGKLFYVLSVNYIEDYAALEVIDGEDEPLAMCYAEPGDVKKMFPKGLEKTTVNEIAAALAAECM